MCVCQAAITKLNLRCVPRGCLVTVSWQHSDNPLTLCWQLVNSPPANKCVRLSLLLAAALYIFRSDLGRSSRNNQSNGSTAVGLSKLFVSFCLFLVSYKVCQIVLFAWYVAYRVSDDVIVATREHSCQVTSQSSSVASNLVSTVMYSVWVRFYWNDILSFIFENDLWSDDAI